MENELRLAPVRNGDVACDKMSPERDNAVVQSAAAIAERPDIAEYRFVRVKGVPFAARKIQSPVSVTY